MRNISFVLIQDIGTVLFSTTNGEANVRDTLARIKSTFPDAPVVISRCGTARRPRDLLRGDAKCEGKRENDQIATTLITYAPLYLPTRISWRPITWRL